MLKNGLLVREGDRSTGCVTYPHVPDEAWIDNNQTSYLVSICLLFLFILASSVSCEEARLWKDVHQYNSCKA